MSGYLCNHTLKVKDARNGVDAGRHLAPLSKPKGRFGANTRAKAQFWCNPMSSESLAFEPDGLGLSPGSAWTWMSYSLGLCLLIHKVGIIEALPHWVVVLKCARHIGNISVRVFAAAAALIINWYQWRLTHDVLLLMNFSQNGRKEREIRQTEKIYGAETCVA